jgi:hypothetical protein
VKGCEPSRRFQWKSRQRFYEDRGLYRTSRHWDNPHPTPRIFCDTLYLRVKILYVSQYFPPEMGAPAARASELAHRWSDAGHEVSVLTGFPNHPTGIVPPEWHTRLRRLAYHEKVGRIDVFRTWLWPLPNRKSHERVRNYASFCLSAALRGLTLPRPGVIIATSPQLLVGLAGGGSLSPARSPSFSKSAISGPNLSRPWVSAVKTRSFITLWPQSLASSTNALIT